jgi:K+-transporting ATPase A subunit
MQSPVPHNSRRRILLWFGFLGGAIAWSIHLVAAALIAEWGCFSGLQQTSYGGITLVAWILILLSGAMFLIALFATLSACAVRKRLPAAGDDSALPPHDEMDQFLARFGVAASGVFTFIILAESLPILYFLTDC